MDAAQDEPAFALSLESKEREGHFALNSPSICRICVFTGQLAVSGIERIR